MERNIIYDVLALHAREKSKKKKEICRRSRQISTHYTGCSQHETDVRNTDILINLAECRKIKTRIEISILKALR